VQISKQNQSSNGKHSVASSHNGKKFIINVVQYAKIISANPKPPKGTRQTRNGQKHTKVMRVRMQIERWVVPFSKPMGKMMIGACETRASWLVSNNTRFAMLSACCKALITSFVQRVGVTEAFKSFGIGDPKE
jgi:hypothetical protein